MNEGNMNIPTRSWTEFIVEPDAIILVTGANGFIGSRVVSTLLQYGCKRIRCLMRPTSTPKLLNALGGTMLDSVEIVRGNLLSRDVCKSVAQGVSLVYHLAAGIEKSFPGCVLNSAVTTRNLLDALLGVGTLKRFVNTSSLAVYSNDNLRRGGLLDETCEIEPDLAGRFDPYAYGKAKQDEVVREYGRTRNLPYVIVRPGLTIGPGKSKIPGRVGIDTFGVFLHLGLNNRMPFTYVDNCAEAIVLAGLRKGIEGEVFNIIDDDLPKSRTFLLMYKQRVKHFTSIPVPYPLFYWFNYLWEKYSAWSEGQLPPAFNRKTCAAYFKGNTYSNRKAKQLLGWHPRVGMAECLDQFYAYAKEAAGKK
jgi:nucleoside-diphosphate-sugar epimerase